jgi:Protein of unknown function (Porph_ging).
VPKEALKWYNFSWSDLRQQTTEGAKPEDGLIVVEAWYTPQIPLNNGPGEFWGLPGLILEVSSDDTILLCTEVVISKGNSLEIKKPSRGKVISKKDYALTVRERMANMRNNRRSRRSR